VTLKWLPIGLWNQGFLSTILPTVALSILPMADSARTTIRCDLNEAAKKRFIDLRWETALFV